MAVSSYAGLGSAHSTTAATLTWAAQESALVRKPILDVLDRDSMIDYSVPGNRLREGPGYIEIVPKTPGEVIGERVLRPLIDATYDWSVYGLEVLKSGFRCFDSIFSRAINVLPGAQAMTTQAKQENVVWQLGPREQQLQQCLDDEQKVFLPIFSEAIKTGNPQIVDAARVLLEDRQEACRETYTQQVQRDLYHELKEDHETHMKNYENALEKCKKDHKEYKCYAKKTDGDPQIFTVHINTNNPGRIGTTTKTDWVVTEGYANWAIFVDYPYASDVRYAEGSYNYDQDRGEPNVVSRKSF